MYSKDELSREDIYKIWDSFRKGSQDSFAEIYLLYQHNLFNYGLRLISDVDLVKDTVHDVFVELWSKRNDLAEVSSVKYYLLSIMKHRLIDKLRKQSKYTLEKPQEDTYDFALELSAESNMILDETLKNQKQTILDALETLSNREKEVIYLRFYDGLSHDEIAQMLNITKKTAYNLLHTAISKLRKQLKPPLFLLLFNPLFQFPSSFFH